MRLISPLLVVTACACAAAIHHPSVPRPLYRVTFTGVPITSTFTLSEVVITSAKGQTRVPITEPVRLDDGSVFGAESNPIEVSADMTEIVFGLNHAVTSSPSSDPIASAIVRSQTAEHVNQPRYECWVNLYDLNGGRVLESVYRSDWQLPWTGSDALPSVKKLLRVPLAKYRGRTVALRISVSATAFAKPGVLRNTVSVESMMAGSTSTLE